LDRGIHAIHAARDLKARHAEGAEPLLGEGWSEDSVEGRADGVPVPDYDFDVCFYVAHC
jgi:hypothetical protein